MTHRAPVLVALAALTISVLGCQSAERDATSYESISRDLTPEQLATAQRRVDMDRNIRVTNDQNLGSMWGDMGRVFYTDHPSRLSPFPVTYTSGTPR